MALQNLACGRVREFPLFHLHLQKCKAEAEMMRECSVHCALFILSKLTGEGTFRLRYFVASMYTEKLFKVFLPSIVFFGVDVSLNVRSRWFDTHKVIDSRRSCHEHSVAFSWRSAIKLKSCGKCDQAMPRCFRYRKILANNELEGDAEGNCCRRLLYSDALSSWDPGSMAAAPIPITRKFHFIGNS